MKFFKNCYDVFFDNGKVIVVEFIFFVLLDLSFMIKEVVYMDCFMLVYNFGGKECIEEEFEVLVKEFGF